MPILGFRYLSSSIEIAINTGSSIPETIASILDFISSLDILPTFIPFWFVRMAIE